MSLQSIMNGGASAPLGRRPAGGMMKRGGVSAPGLSQPKGIARGAADLLSRPSRPHRKGYKQSSTMGPSGAAGLLAALGGGGGAPPPMGMGGAPPSAPGMPPLGM